MKQLVFDFETTGFVLHPLSKLEVQPRIIEVGAALVEGSDVLDQLAQLVDPGVAISDEITKVTGITNDDLRGQPKFSEVMPRLRSMFEQADFITAHNLMFDRNALMLELHRHQVTDWPWPEIGVCTVEEHIAQRGRRLKLTDLYLDTTGDKLAQTHRALDDVMALVEIVQGIDLESTVAAAVAGAL